MTDFLLIYCIVCLIFAAGLGLIPAFIAKEKGYSFGLWWFYGWMLFIVAIIHILLIPDKNAPVQPVPPSPQGAPRRCCGRDRQVQGSAGQRRHHTGRIRPKEKAAAGFVVPVSWAGRGQSRPPFLLCADGRHHGLYPPAAAGKSLIPCSPVGMHGHDPL